MSKIALNSNASGTGVFTIASPNSDTDRTLTLPDESGTIVSENASGDVAVTGDITSNGNAVITTQSPQLGRRNLIINGDMQVWQRGASSTSGSLDYHTVDRFWNYLASGGTVQRSTDVPSGEGFVYSYRLTSNGYWAVGQPIELPVTGKTILKNNTDYTLSFWAKAATSEAVTVAIRYADAKGNGNNRVSLASSTPTIGTSWVRYSLTFNTGTAAPIATNEIIDIEIADGNALDIYLTGIQFEAGDVATPFEHRSYGEELALCQRYYQKFGNTGTDEYKRYAVTSCDNSTNSRGIFHFPVPMRVFPTLTTSGTLANYSGGTIRQLSSLTLNPTWTETAGNYSHVSLFAQVSSGQTAGNAGMLLSNVSASSLAFDSEL